MSASREKKKRQATPDAASAQASSASKGMSKTGKTVLYVVLAVIIVAAIVFFAMVSTGFFVTHTVAATVNGYELSPAMVNYFYGSAYQSFSSSMGDSLSMFIDSSKPLDEQAYYTDEFATWEDYFLDTAFTTAHEVYAVYEEALANGYTLTEDDTAQIENEMSMLDLYATVNGYSSGATYLTYLYGQGCTLDTYREYLTISLVATNYASQILDSYTYSADEISAYYDEHTEDFDGVTYRLYSVNVPSSDDEDFDNDAALAECETKAKEMAEASQGDEQAYLDYTVELADEDNKETYEDETYTLREDYTLSSCGEAYREWLADSAREPGDTTYIQNGDLGYYVLYFIEHTDRTYQLPNVRHILVSVSDTTDEDAMATAKEDAQEILDEFLAGDATEESFAALADEKSADSPEGGLYENITPGSMVESFENWCFDPDRQVGDTDIIETEYGYHVMYFSGYGKIYRDYLVEETLRNNDYTAWESEVIGETSYTTNAFGMRFIASR